MAPERRDRSLLSAWVALGAALVTFSAVSLWTTASNSYAPVAVALASAAVAGIAALHRIRETRGRRDRRQVFVSYSMSDLPQARAIASWLMENGYQPWLASENIREGEPWRRAVREAIDHSAAVLVVVPENGKLSESVSREIGLAMRSMNSMEPSVGPVIPIFQTPGTLELPEALRAEKFFRFYDETDRARLAESLDGVMGVARRPAHD